MLSPEEQSAMLIRIERDLRENTETTKSILTAFPGGDTDGHRRFHEAEIEWRELRNKMVREALIKVSQAGALAAAAWIGLAIWQAFITTVKQ